VKTFAKYFPWLVVAAFSLYAAGKMVPKRQTYKEFDLTAFGAIPVLDSGRVQPLDSVARTHMLAISGKSDFEDAQGDTRPAILWLLETLAWGDPHSGPAADHRVFRVDNEQLLGDLGLPERPGSYRYSWNEISKNAAQFETLFAKAREIDEKKRDLFHSKVLQLAERMHRYESLAAGRAPTLIPLEKGSNRWLSLQEVDSEFLPPRPMEIARQQATDEIREELSRERINLKELPVSEQEKWFRKVERRARQIIRDVSEERRKTVSPAAGAFTEILKAYRENKPKAFAETIASYRPEHVEPLHPDFRDTTRFEMTFNAAAPFFVAAIMYVFAGVLMSLSWLGWSTPFRRAAFGLTGVALILHFGALLGRMYLMGRPLVFVTNLYSSALLIGFGAVAGCLILERLFRNGVALVAGTTLGAITVKIAHHLSTEGKDTLGSLVAVLDTNFWLASHVTTVTLGYSATYFAGLLGIVYVAWGLFFSTLTKEKHHSLGNMIYGVVCFATLLSFLGTVLGGIWADQSWGRFWGWDPKENGAVLIVIWNALILHARWGGIVRQRGMAVLAVVGIMVTTWSWFGTNQLGIGLHNYGFNQQIAEWCKWTWIVCAGLVAIGLIPTRYWRSFAPTGEPRPEAKAAQSTATPGTRPAPDRPAQAVAQNGATEPARHAPGQKPARRR
jgi:ABC-type transport system involved in cytochrome c biogenesis permease subunit